MIPHLPKTLFVRSGLISRLDFFLPWYLVMWTTNAYTVRELIRSAPGHELVVLDGDGRNLWVRKVGGHWLGLVLRETER